MSMAISTSNIELEDITMPYKDKQKMKAYQSRWHKDNTKGFYIRLSKSTDADIISWLSDLSNKQGYIKELIRADIRAENSID